jgi:phenylacetate-coenzyme A ligase PaaK-like adenylate-forming protein
MGWEMLHYLFFLQIKVEQQLYVINILNINFEYKIIIKKNDNENLLTLDIEKEGTKTSLNNLYSPNNDSGICEIIENVVNKSIVITGDFNLVQNHFWFQLYLSIELSYDQDHDGPRYRIK